MDITISLDLDFDDDETLEERVISAAATQCMHGKNIRDKVDKAVTTLVHEAVTTAVAARVAAAVDASAASIIQPTNSYGQPDGEPVTIQEMVMRHAEGYLTAKVDSYGKADSYGGTPRIERLMKEAGTLAWDRQIKPAIDAEIVKLGKVIHAKAVAQFAEKLKTLVGA